MRISREQMFMDIAEIVAKRSACLRNNVGAVIVNKENNIVAIGYNGVPSGIPHCTSECCIKGCSLAIHAEDNAIRRMPKNYDLLDSYCIFCTVSPCQKCAHLIVERRDIKTLYYRYDYRDKAGITYLLMSGIKVYKILTGGIINEEEI